MVGLCEEFFQRFLSFGVLLGTIMQFRQLDQQFASFGMLGNELIHLLDSFWKELGISQQRHIRLADLTVSGREGEDFQEGFSRRFHLAHF